MTGKKTTLIWTPHPVVDFIAGYRALSDNEIAALLAAGTSEMEIEDYWRAREKRIQLSIDDPLRHGFELPFWNDVRALLARKDEVFALGGNGPGKTEIGGKLVCEKLCEAAGMKVLCVATNEASSKQLQQAGVYKYLPVTARGLNERRGPRKHDTVKNITYSQKNGFTEGTFVLPNRSQCWFKTVEQFLRDSNSFEGPEYDLVWIDEPAPLSLITTLTFRIAKRRGKFFFTFTAVNGFDATCAMVLTGAKVLKSLPMNWAWNLNHPDTRTPSGKVNPQIKVPELSLEEVQIKGLPPGHMPYLMQPLNPAQGVIFLWTQWNVFLPRSRENAAVPAVFDKVARKSKGTVRMRLFGWAEKLSGCQFPAFNPNVHVIPHEKILDMLQPRDGRGCKLTTYMACDPATARSYFMLWIGVDPLGRKFIFDESPRVEEGEWVSDDGERGDGTRLYGGRGTNFYKGYIRAREQEHGVQACRRFGDPRAFATEAAAKEGGRSLLELFADCDESDAENALTGPMLFEPAKVMRSLLAEAASGSLDKINDAFSYDNEKEINVENEPHLYLSERCENLIRAILNWDPAQGDKSPWKDPVDVLRYLFGEPLHYVDPNVPEIVQGKGW